ncbi:MAG: STAS domain-containing protein [Acidobacteria bacterium]|nr:STAS domain-containing protein [Acidobacteriota bacterium]
MWLKIDTELREPAIAIIRVAGRIVLGRASQELEWKIVEILKGSPRVVVVDLGDVTHIDSTGVGILVMCSGKAKSAGAELRLAGARGAVEQVLRLTRVNDIIPMFAAADDAARENSSAQTA